MRLNTNNSFSNKKISLLILFLLLTSFYIIYNLNYVSALPTPFYVEGQIYDVNASLNTSINRSVNISLTNTNTGNVVSGVTSNSDPSHFIISSGGELGDILTLKVWNREHEYEKNYTLDGSLINGESMLLEMTILQNYAPDFISEPIISATENQNYNYSIITEDYNYNAVTLNLVQGPAGMAFNSQTKTLNWTPNHSDANTGSYNIILSASDGLLTSFQNFTINVINVNDAPIISSYPPLSAKETSLYTYQINATDKDDDILNYSIIEAPSGMNINNDTGLLTWTPIIGDAGDYALSINVSDGNLSTIQEWTLYVGPEDNNDPIITSAASTNAYVNQEYTYQLTATDADGDALSYYIYSAPTNAYIEYDGLIHWVPSENDLSSPIALIVMVFDSMGGTAFQINYITVSTFTQTTSTGSKQKNPLLIEVPFIPSQNTIIIPSYLIINETKTEVKDKEVESYYEIANLSLLNINIFFDKDNYNKTKILLKEFSKIEGIASPPTFVYKYYEIKLENENNKVLDAKIRFSVTKGFLKKLNIESNNIALLRYHNNTWNTLETNILTEKDQTFEYESTTQGFSYFAISLKNITAYPDTKTYKKSPVYNTSGLITISGKIFTSAKVIQVNRLTKYVIINNNTKQEYLGFTGIIDKDNQGSYTSQIKASKGDRITFKVYEKNEAVYEKTFIITNDKEMKLDIYTGISPSKKSMIIILSIIFFIVLLLLYGLWIKKKKKYV